MRRIVDYISTIKDAKTIQNKMIRKFYGDVGIALSQAKESEDPTFFFNIHYCISRKNLSNAARDELIEIQETAKSISEIDGVLCEVSINTYLIPDILEEQWRVNNETWSNITGGKNEWIDLRYSGRMIDDQNCQIFFCRSIDLINAYKELGQRLFAPNVRCYLSNTPVNARIEESVRTVKGITNFKYMNNGLTIVGENVEKKNGKIRVQKPGIINGLQTIRSLYEAFQKLKDNEIRQHFSSNCEVLVRVFGGKKTTLSTEDLIIATNNQNKMDPRNLKSNTSTQKTLEQRFADYGWFYERKEKAWDAFVESEGTWDTLPGRKPANFGGKARSSRKNLDNSIVATSYLAFIGFSEIARNRKSVIFSEENLYKRIFERKFAKHGYHYQYQFSKAEESDEMLEGTPPASMMLLSALVYSTSKQVSASTQDVKKRHIEKLHIDKLSTEQQNVKLFEDADYLAALMVASSPFLFTEFFGFIFCNISPEFRSDAAVQILKKSDLYYVYSDKNYSKISDTISSGPSDSDVFSSIYHLFEYLLSELADSEVFRRDLINASSRPSFLHSNTTRRKLIDRILELDTTIERRGSLGSGLITRR